MEHQRRRRTFWPDHDAATFTAAAATNAAQSATITATSVADPTKSASATITVPAAVAVTTAALPAAAVGTAYSQALAASGGIPKYAWTITSGTLPSCLSINSAGVISGTPTASCVGTTSLTFKATDSGTATPLSATSASLSLNIAPAPAIVLPPGGPLLAGIVGNSYTISLAGTGGAGTLSYSISAGALPTGLTISAAGTVTGTPTAAGPFSFTVMASDAFGDSQTQPYTIQINYPAVTIAPAAGALPAAITGSAYSQSLTAGGGSGTGFVWTVTGLPADGISATANGATLAISGTPTSTSNISFTASVKDGAGNVIGPFTYTIAVFNPISLPATDPPSLPANISTNAPYSGTITATGGSGSGYIWTVNGLSDGLTSSNSGGTLTISGTPTTASTVTFTVSVKDSSGSSAGPITYTITVNSVLTLPATNPATLPGNATIGTAYSGAVTVTGGSGTGYVFTVTGLPSDGISSSVSGGTLTVSGTPTTTGPVTVTVSVKDSLGNSAGPIAYTINVYNPIVLPASPGTLPSIATVNVVYNGTVVATGGSGSGYTWTVTGLSDGLTSSFTGATLSITGTPTSANTVTFMATVKDSAGNTAGPLTYTVNVFATLTLPATNPGSLPAGIINQAYSGTISVGGGSGTGYVWTVTGFPADGLNYSVTGATLTIAGTPTSATTVSFTASVKDSLGNTTGPIAYTIPVYAALTLPASNPATLPTNVQSGISYSGTIVASGGSGSGYVFTVTGLSDGLNYTSNGATLTISGTPAAAGTVSFNVSVKDSANLSAGPVIYSINFYAPISLPNPNPNTLPSATINQAYQGSINGGGGVLPYTWTVQGTVVPNNGSSVALIGGQGLTVSASNNNVLSFSGTPTAGANVSIPVQLQDSLGNKIGPFTYSIQINAVGSSQVSGQILSINNCGATAFLPTFTVTINTTPPQQATTNNFGNYSFASVPNGTYTITPSIPGASSVFLPATQTVVVANSSVNGENFNAAFGYTVSGNVSYAGAETGQVYLSLQGDCGVSNGTSIPFSSLSSGGAFTIHGVPPGSYTLNARIDNLGIGVANAINPTGATGNLTVSNANLSGETINLTNATVTAPSSAPTILNVSPTDLGAVIDFKTVTSKGIEAVTSYLLQWSTDPTFNTGISSTKFRAIGTGTSTWIVNNATAGQGSFVNGTTYYFRACGQTSAGNGPFADWGAGTPTAVIIGTPSGAGFVTITGTVTIPAGITPTGPLYAGFYDQNTGAVYDDLIASPVVGSNNYTVQVPIGSDPMFNFGILDQNNDGLIDLGDVTNTQNAGNGAAIAISSNLSNQDVTLPTVDSNLTVRTQFLSNINAGGTFNSYQLELGPERNQQAPRCRPVDLRAECALPSRPAVLWNLRSCAIPGPG